MYCSAFALDADRFVQGWDELCIQQLLAAEAAEAAETGRPGSGPNVTSGAGGRPGVGPDVTSPPGRPSSASSRPSRVVISTYPPGYGGEGAAATLDEDPPVTLLCAQGFGSDGECL